MEGFIEIFPDRASRPVSVRDYVKLREEAGAERHDDGYRAESWSTVLREVLGWYNGYRWLHLLFRNPEENLVRAPLENSHQPSYGNVYYAKLKALERRVLSEFEDPHIVMLTLTGSMKQGVERHDGRGWRCPADHLREVVAPFGSSVRKALHRELDVERWEYAKVLEHHKNGYGHMHVAVFVDGTVTEADFRPAIDAHLRNCDIAGADAHDYHHPDPEKRPISLNRVDPDARLKRRRAEGMLWLDDEPADPNAHDVEVFGGRQRRLTWPNTSVATAKNCSSATPLNSGSAPFVGPPAPNG